jgi:hypothetical protein
MKELIKKRFFLPKILRGVKFHPRINTFTFETVFLALGSRSNVIFRQNERLDNQNQKSNEKNLSYQPSRNHLSECA